MARRAANEFFSGGFNGIRDNVDEMHFCSQEPADYSAATTTDSLGSVSMVPGDFIEAEGDVSGRRLRVAEKTITGSNDGIGDHIALVDTTNEILYYVTPATPVSITNGVDQDFAAWNIEIADPVAP